MQILKLRWSFPHDTEEIGVYLISKKLLSIPGTKRVKSKSDWGKTAGFSFFFLESEVRRYYKEL